MERVAPSDRLKQELAALLSAGLRPAEADPAGQLVRLATRLVFQEALEQERADSIGRGRYERGEVLRQGYRNGDEPAALHTVEGRLGVAAASSTTITSAAGTGKIVCHTGIQREIEPRALLLGARGRCALIPQDLQDRSALFHRFPQVLGGIPSTRFAKQPCRILPLGKQGFDEQPGRAKQLYGQAGTSAKEVTPA